MHPKCAGRRDAAPYGMSDSQQQRNTRIHHFIIPISEIRKDERKTKILTSAIREASRILRRGRRPDAPKTKEYTVANRKTNHPFLRRSATPKTKIFTSAIREASRILRRGRRPDAPKTKILTSAIREASRILRRGRRPDAPKTKILTSAVREARYVPKRDERFPTAKKLPHSPLHNSNLRNPK